MFTKKDKFVRAVKEPIPDDVQHRDAFNEILLQRHFTRNLIQTNYEFSVCAKKQNNPTVDSNKKTLINVFTSKLQNN